MTPQSRGSTFWWLYVAALGGAALFILHTPSSRAYSSSIWSRDHPPAGLAVTLTHALLVHDEALSIGTLVGGRDETVFASTLAVDTDPATRPWTQASREPNRRRTNPPSGSK